MARPKGSLNKIKNLDKYWLPDDVKLSLNNPEIYNCETKLIFIDEYYGEFISCFRWIRRAKASTHPIKVQQRREETNKMLYGGTNPSCSKEIRQKAKNTMIDKYGVEHALLNPEFLEKSQKTLFSNYGVKTPMESSEIKEIIKDAFKSKYGVENPMQCPDIVKKLSDTYFEKTGYKNPGQNPESIEKGFKTLIKNGKGRPSSKGEIELLEFIRSLDISANKGYLGGENPKEIDIKIPDKKIAIEYNGVYWHNSNKIPNNYHLQKTLLAESKGYKLLHFFDFEWKDRKEQIKSFLTSALGKNQIKVFARKTELKLIEKNEAKKFLNDYHILGSVGFKYAYGLYKNNELLAMITLNLHHRNSNEMVLNRYVGKYNVTVVGGLDKLTKHAVKIHGSITTWIDRRISNGISWINTGWKLVHILKPDYFYFDPKTNNVISKQSRQKKKINTPIDMTESEHAKKDGLLKIYDCGKLKLIYNI